MDAFDKPSISQIVPGIFIGNVQSTYEAECLQNNHINAIVSLVNAPLALWKQKRFTDSATKGRHLWVECVDSSTFDILEHLSRVCNFIDRMLLPVAESSSTESTPINSSSGTLRTKPNGHPLPQNPGRVLVHCDLGISRSGTVVVAYLMRKQHKSRDEVLTEVQAKRKRVRPSTNFMRQLQIWEQVQYQIWEDVEKKVPKKEYAAYREERAAALKAKGLTGNEPMRPLDL